MNAIEFSHLTFRRKYTVRSLLFSWTSSLELSADGPQTAGFVIQPFQTIAEDFLHVVSWTKAKCKSPSNCALKLSYLTYLLIDMAQRRRSVGRASVSDWRTFPDMRLIYGSRVATSWVRRPQ